MLRVPQKPATVLHQPSPSSTPASCWPRRPQDAEIITVESMGDRKGLSTLQQCFIDNGAIQCGYCTPAQMLAAKALLDRNANPTEDQVRDAIGGVLCRCTGYVKPVQAVMNAAAIMRGESPDDLPAPFKRVIARPRRHRRTRPKARNRAAACFARTLAM